MKLRLLIGESVPFLAEMYHEKLTNLRCDVTLCYKDDECLYKYQQHARISSNNLENKNPFDVVIMDDGLMQNGIKTVNDIISINPKQKILFITGRKENFLPKQCIEIIEKPFSMKNFIQRLGKMNETMHNPM